jgi:hypothetical protein
MVWMMQSEEFNEFKKTEVTAKAGRERLQEKENEADSTQ